MIQRIGNLEIAFHWLTAVLYFSYLDSIRNIHHKRTSIIIIAKRKFSKRKTKKEIFAAQDSSRDNCQQYFNLITCHRIPASTLPYPVLSSNLKGKSRQGTYKTPYPFPSCYIGRILYLLFIFIIYSTLGLISWTHHGRKKDLRVKSVAKTLTCSLYLSIYLPLPTLLAAPLHYVRTSYQR